MRFRMQALVHQGEPEELDVLPRLVRSKAWVAAGVLLAALAAAVVWSVIGSLPRTLTAQGLLTLPGGLTSVQSPLNGVVQSLPVSAGQQVKVGDTVANLVDATGQAHAVPSPFAGRVVTVSVAVGQPVQLATSLVSVQRSSEAKGPLQAMLFVPSDKAAELRPGMSSDLAVNSAPSVAFGLLRGHIASVNPYPLTPGQAQALLGNEVLAQKFLAPGAVQLVTVDLQRDGSTRSGYKWTSADGPPFPLLPQALLSATVQVGDQHPISFVFGH